jgi:two-component system chemotaxis response regulator CheB
MTRSIKVLVCDDSVLARQTLTAIINADPQLAVVGTAADPFFAASKIRDFIPDVITLDIEMPRMDGITFLKRLMSQYPVPVVIISSLTQKGSHLALQAMELGAVEIVAKSELRNTKEHLEESRIRITDTIKAAAMVNVKARSSAKKVHAPRILQKTPEVNAIYKTTDKVIAIGASTGGTEALRYFLLQIPANSPGILITQHMPSGFTRSFADQLNTVCDITVKEAQDGERVMRGHAYIAPGGRHMELYKSDAKYFIKVRDGELVNRHKPSVDVLFHSVAQHAGENALGIILTGMGSDGAEGLLHMKETGASTVAQDEKSSVVFGMPKEAIKLGAADQVLSLTDIPRRALAFSTFRPLGK